MIKLSIAVAALMTLYTVPPTAQAKSFTGTYVLGRGQFQNRLRVSQLSNKRIWFFLNAYKEYRSEDGEIGANMGDTGGTIPFTGNKAEWKASDGPGKLQFTFTDTTCTIKQIGSDFECGFGHGVDASGVYQKISSKVIPLKRN